MLIRSVFHGRGFVTLSQGGGDPAPPGTIPLSFDDSFFTGMSESTSLLTLSAGQTANRRSIVESSGEPTITLEGNNQLTNSRVKSRECIRIGGIGGTILIDGCYLEAEGAGDDHADGIQAFAGAGGCVFDITLSNSHVRAFNTAATAGFFIADKCVGDVHIINTIFQGGPYGIKFHSDTNGDINVWMEDVFFVGPFGTDPFTFLDFGGNQVVIQQWDNVREATIVNDVLVPGDLIPSPA